MKHLVLFLFAMNFSARAFAACELQVLAENRRLKTPLVSANQNSAVGVYQARLAGASVTVEWDHEQKQLSARAVDANGGTFEFKLGSVDMLEELDCSGGSTGDSKFVIKCDSNEWRAMKAKNGWERHCRL